MMNDASNKFDTLYSVYSDVYKDAYGFRPTNWDQIRTLSASELEKEIDELAEIASDQISLEKAQEEEAAKDLIAAHRKLMMNNSIGAAAAWRWLLQAERNDSQTDYYAISDFLWRNGVGCGDLAENMTSEILAMLSV